MEIHKYTDILKKYNKIREENSNGMRDSTFEFYSHWENIV